MLYMRHSPFLRIDKSTLDQRPMVVVERVVGEGPDRSFAFREVGLRSLVMCYNTDV